MINKLFQIYKPIHLLLAILTYVLGVGISHYLGYSVKIAVFCTGLLATLPLHAATYFLAEYFCLPINPLAANESHQQRIRFRTALLQVSYAAITLSTVSVVSLLLSHSLNLYAGIIYILIFLLLTIYAIPPVSLSANGYGEIALAIFMGSLVPSFAFLLQSGLVNRLLAFATFPITLIALAFLLIWDFPTYATDLKLAHPTLLTRLTWQRAIPVHHLLLLAAFLFFSLASLLKIPWEMIWPVFLALPFGIVQVIRLQQIANGGRTLWNFLIPLSTTTFGLSVYLLALTFWIR